MLLSFVFYFYIIKISTNTFLYEKFIAVSILPYLFYFLIGLYTYKYKDMLFKYIENKVLYYAFLYVIVLYFSVDNFIYLLVKQLVFALLIFSFAFSYKTLSYSLIKHNDFTYGIYIYHMLIINIFIQIEYVREIKTLVSALFLSVICGILSYFIVEKPFLKLKIKSLYNEIK